jgi:hypothetical protein
MEISIAEFAEARDTVAKLLERLRLDACLFDLEPQQGEWSVKIECKIEEGWEELTLRVGKDELSRTREDDGVREAMLRAWRERLAACKKT